MCRMCRHFDARFENISMPRHASKYLHVMMWPHGTFNLPFSIFFHLFLRPISCQSLPLVGVHGGLDSTIGGASWKCGLLFSVEDWNFRNRKYLHTPQPLGWSWRVQFVHTSLVILQILLSRKKLVSLEEQQLHEIKCLDKPKLTKDFFECP